jgi:hypothetical protein
MSTLDYCDAVTQTGKLCSRKAVCDSSKRGAKYCTQHFDAKGLNYYDPSKGKFIVNKIARVTRDKTTGLPMRYVQNLSKKEKQLYKKEIEATNKYYKRTGLVKGRADVRSVLNKRKSRTPKSQYAKSVSLPKKRSSYSEEFERRYGFKISDLSKVKKLFPDTDVDMIIKKGEAAYASGSRPSVTGIGGARQWGLARLSSSLLAGKAMSVDKNLIGPKSLKVIFSK